MHAALEYFFHFLNSPRVHGNLIELGSFYTTNLYTSNLTDEFCSHFHTVHYWFDERFITVNQLLLFIGVNADSVNAEHHVVGLDTGVRCLAALSRLGRNERLSKGNRGK